LTNKIIEEEKKVLGPLLGKIHVSPASTEEKIREVYDEVSIAVDDKLISDAAGRNALYKIHVSLGKIVNGLGDRRKSSIPDGRMSMAPEEKTDIDEDEDVDVDEKTVMNVAPTIEEDEEAEDDDNEETVMGNATTSKRQPRDSLVDELLSDDDDL
jgi:condensin complex subunit 3